MKTLLILLSMTLLQENPEFPHPELSMKCYPETVTPGDSLYIRLVVKNPHTKSIYIPSEYWSTDHDIQTHIRDSENQKQPLFFESPMKALFNRSFFFTEIKPGDSRVIEALAINIPPLEDLKEPFWEKHLKKLSTNTAKFSFNVTVTSCLSVDGEYPYGSNAGWPVTMETSLIMKQRPEKEITLIREWQKSQTDFPETQEGNGRKAANCGFKDSMPKNIVIKKDFFGRGTKYSHWYFVRIGNRYPSSTNIPASWQDWKKLEESLTPSTMRDEIRLTRILIQYCDTEDANVLKELKDWFTDMNEVQRTAMARSLRDRAVDCYGNDKLLPPFREVYKTIREYDMVPPYEGGDKHLRNLGLIE